jgi:hypothetical protein
MPARASAAAGRRWVRPAGVVQALTRRWQKGEFLVRLAGGGEWQPLAMPLRAPTSSELAADFGAVQHWAREWEQAASGPLRLEYTTVGGRLVGTNRVPHKVWIDSYEALWQVLGVEREVARFGELLTATRAECPAVAEWMAANPMRVLTHEAAWPRLIGVVQWIEVNAGPAVYLRQIDVPRVDTKFVEQHRGILCELLDRQLPAERVDRDQPCSQFAARYRLAKKPAYVRLRRADNIGLLTATRDVPGGGPAELTLRTEDLAVLPVDARTVFVVENETTYLAFPPVNDAVVIHGAGYGLSRLAPLTWLHERDLIYWGDVDTHGFAILDQLRSAFPHARSMLMDAPTFVAHESHWTHEPKPVNTDLPMLTEPEANLYRDLIEDRYGQRLRLEQERVQFSAVQAAIQQLFRA